MQNKITFGDSVFYVDSNIEEQIIAYEWQKILDEAKALTKKTEDKLTRFNPDF